MYNVALSYINAKLSVIPIIKNDKAPAIKKWQPFQKSIMTTDQAWQNFNDDNGIAVVCGQVSGGLECLDFDNHFGDAGSIMRKFAEIVEVEEVIDKHNLLIEKSPSGGYHLFFRSATPEGSQKLARRINTKKRPETLIETRGEGGYVVVAPSHGYEVSKGTFDNIAKISNEDRDILLSAARSFNEYADERDYASTSSYLGGEGRPGNEYDKDSAAIEEAKSSLSAAGWKTSNGVHWIRPGKKKGISATFGKVAPNVFYVFSSNAHPFEDRKAYTPWQIYAILEHNFDFESAAKELAKRGYGSKKNDNLKVVYSKVRVETRRGQKLTPEEINELAEKINIPVTTVKGTVEKAEKKYIDEWEYEKLPAIKKTEIFLKNNYEFKQDVISRLPYMKVKGGAWEDFNIHTIYRKVQHENIKFAMDKLKSLLQSDYVPRFNPFVDYFSKLPAWDGEDHISKLCSYFKCEDSVFFHRMFEKALVRNIACALDPKYYNRIVFTIVSENQEIGKSWFIQWLNPFGHDYYTDEQLRDNKDSQLALCENFIYNLEELDSLSRVDISQLKATISKRGVKDRLPYAMNKEYFPRCCSFWGSTNRQEFLVDDKNTRWMCFYITDIDWKYAKEVDLLKLWAQAWHLYNSKEYVYTLNVEEGKNRDAKNENYRVVDFEMSLLQKHFEHSNTQFMSNAEIMTALFDRSEGKIKMNTTPQKLGRILAQLGFERTRKGNERGWKVKVKPLEAVADNSIDEPKF